MPRTQEVTAYYIRTRKGECFYVDTLAEALEEFLGINGYRLTLSSSTNELVLRRDSDWTWTMINGFETNIEKESSARMIFRKKEEKLPIIFREKEKK